MFAFLSTNNPFNITIFSENNAKYCSWLMLLLNIEKLASGKMKIRSVVIIILVYSEKNRTKNYIYWKSEKTKLKVVSIATCMSSNKTNLLCNALSIHLLHSTTLYKKQNYAKLYLR